MIFILRETRTTVREWACCPSFKATPSAVKKCFFREVASFDSDNLEVFYYISVSEIWPEKGLALGGGYLIKDGLLYIDLSYKRWTTVYRFIL
jgi:hypothetical protein